MFEDAFQNAFDGVWTNTIGRLSDRVPDWLAWIVSLQFETWAALAIGIAIGFVLAKWGWKAVLILGGAFLTMFTLGRNSKK